MENLQVVDNAEINVPKKGRGQYVRVARGGYKKDKVDGKITIKYFINTKLQAYQFRDDSKGINQTFYDVYVRVSVKSQTTQIPMNNFYSFQTDEDLQRAIESGEFVIDNEIILWIINKLRPFEREDFLIKEFTEIYKMLNRPVSTLVEDLLLKEVNNRGVNTYKVGFNFWDTNRYRYNTIPVIREIYTDTDMPKHKALDLLNTYKSDIWGLFAYEHLNYVRKKMKNKNKTSDLPVSSFDLKSFLYGNYQKELLEEFGKDIMQPIFDDIYTLFEKNLKQFSLLFK